MHVYSMHVMQSQTKHVQSMLDTVIMYKDIKVNISNLPTGKVTKTIKLTLP